MPAVGLGGLEQIDAEHADRVIRAEALDLELRLPVAPGGEAVLRLRLGEQVTRRRPAGRGGERENQESPARAHAASVEATTVAPQEHRCRRVLAGLFKT